MATVATLAQGTRSAALVTMGTLASGTYIASSSIDLGAAIPVDITLDVVATPGTGQSGQHAWPSYEILLDSRVAVSC